MMSRNSFRDAATGVLKSHGFMETNGVGDIKQTEAEDFNLEPGKWQWDGTKWIVFSPSKSQRKTDSEDAQAKIDDVIADNAIPKKVRDALAAIKRLVAA